MNDVAVLASDIMIPVEEYPSLHPDATLKQAINLFVKNQMRDKKGDLAHPRLILVMDEANRLLGQVRRRDILRGLEPGYLTTHSADHPKSLFDINPDPTLSRMLSENSTKIMKARTGQPVKLFMQPLIGNVRVNDSILTVINQMVDRNQSIIPVLEENRVIGIIRSIDVLHTLNSLFEDD